MKFAFKQADGLLEGISLLAQDLDITLVNDHADVVVSVEERGKDILSVTLDGRCARIVYGGGKARFFRGLAFLVDAVKRGEKTYTLSESPIFKLNGAMASTGGAVMKVSTVKTMLRKMALMGLNMYMLYTEDTYEIEGRPYFGHMRGRYTKEEIREIDAYALALGIELIPCIQVLGHLASHLKWDAAAAYRDTASVMLVGADETYRLIEDMLKTVKECFTTKRVHVGMDETKDVGLGTYLKLNGYRPQEDIYFEHLGRVIKMAEAEGLEPMMWSDMFFRLAGKDLSRLNDYDMRVEFTDEIKAKIPKGIQQVFWDYYQEDEEYYRVNLKKHHDLFGKKDTLFAGGIWLWSGCGPLFERSVRFSIPALNVCREMGVKEIIATIWGGNESDLILSLAGLAWYADYEYKGGFDLDSAKECFRVACNADYDDIMKTELCQHPNGDLMSLSRALLHNDPLIGLVDKHIRDLDTVTYYKNAYEKMMSHGQLGIFAEAYDVTLKLTSLLENKANFGVRLKAAYDSGNKEALLPFVTECDIIIEKMGALREAHYKAWMLHNKPFGWEVKDIHYGATIARFETAKKRIAAYIAGEIDTIEELAEERLYLIDTPNEDDRFGEMFLWMQFSKYATAANLL